MTRDEAAAVLGCPVDSSAGDVRKAFAVKVKATHPDLTAKSSDSPFFDSLVTLAGLKKARDVLLANAPTDCPDCKGTGWVSAGGFKQVRCRRGC